MNMINRQDPTPLPPGTYIFNETSGFAAPFTEAAKKAKPGEVVLVETTFGYHVIKRVK